MGVQFTLLGHGLVHREDAEGLGGGFEVEQWLARCGVGRRVHPGGDAQAEVVAQGGAAGVQQLLGGGGRELRQHRVQAGVGEESVRRLVFMVTDGGQLFALEGFYRVGIDTGAFQHGLVGPAGVVIPADENDWLVRPFALVEALLELRHLAPVGRGQAADAEDVAVARLAVVAPLAQALFQLGHGQELGVDVGRGQLKAAHHGVGMGVDEARHQHLAAHIDHVGAGFLQPQNLGVAADGADLAVLHRHGLLQGLAGFGGVDLGVVKNEIHRGHAFHRGTGERGGDQGGGEGFHRVFPVLVGMALSLTKPAGRQNAIFRTTFVPIRNR
ncbi:hypothetical protein D9M69_338050 [compost metagenome]